MTCELLTKEKKHDSHYLLQSITRSTNPLLSFAGLLCKTLVRADDDNQIQD